MAIGKEIADASGAVATRRDAESSAAVIFRTGYEDAEASSSATHLSRSRKEEARGIVTRARVARRESWVRLLPPSRKILISSTPVPSGGRAELAVARRSATRARLQATDETESAMGWVFERGVRVPCAYRCDVGRLTWKLGESSFLRTGGAPSGVKPV